jgi:hypothetical protein
MNIFREPFLNYLAEKGIPLRVEEGQILLPGFYKYDAIELRIDEQQVYAIDRYFFTNYIGEKIESNEFLFQSLVRYNHEVWAAYKDRGYKSPSGIWLPHMLKLGLVKEKISYE